MPAQLDPCPSYQKRTKLKQKGPDDCSVTYGTPRRLDTGYVVLHCLASLVGSRGREDGRKCRTSSDSLPERQGSQWETVFIPSVTGGSQGVFPRLRLAALQPNPCLHGLFGCLQGGQVTRQNCSLTILWPTG